MTGVLFCNFTRSEFETEFTYFDTNVIKFYLRIMSTIPEEDALLIACFSKDIFFYNSPVYPQTTLKALKEFNTTQAPAKKFLTCIKNLRV